MGTEKENRNSVPIIAPGIGTRISEAAKCIGSRRNAADAADVSTDSLQRYIREEVQPPFEAMAGLAKSSGKSLDWLAFNNEHQTVNDTQGQYDSSKFSLIPLYDVAASAGPGAAIDQENQISELAFRSDWLVQEGLNNGKLSAIMADGDSMEPAILDGSVLLIDSRQRNLAGERIYILRLRDHLYAKRLQRLHDGAVRVSSDNPAYADELVPADELDSLDIIGRVVWIGRRV